MKYVPINEFITIGDEVFKCTQATSRHLLCENCDFYVTNNCDEYQCTERVDQEEVIFILYDNISEDSLDD